MPELPDILGYLAALRQRIVGQRLESISVRSPFVVRSVQPELDTLRGRVLRDLSRIGKRIVWHFDDELFLVFHLMIAGRFHWKKPGVRPAGKNDLAAFGFALGTLMLTEASQKKRASLHVVQGRGSLEQFHRGGIEPLDCSASDFRAALTRENHTLKRALADPRLFSGIGNAYSDEILHAASLSPVMLTSRLKGDEVERLFVAVQRVLGDFTRRIVVEAERKFPEKVTAFRPDMAVHGRHGQPCLTQCSGANRC